jgi:DNA mismatch endonuclease (patch repair protein)
MAKVHGKDTAPELFVRQTAHALGYRFRIHRADLPGCPDLVFPSRRKVIFVHGCFWHQHKGCKRASLPKTRKDFWTKKFASNVARDERNIAALVEAGWEVLVLWECSLQDRNRVVQELRSFLDASINDLPQTTKLSWS